MVKQSHIIGKQTIEISFDSLDNAVGIQNRIAEIFYERIQPEMELLLDKATGEKYIATIDRLEVDCGILTHKNWEDEWVEMTLHKLKEKLVALDNKLRNADDGGSQSAVIEEEQTALSTNATHCFFFFLENGHLPWNHRINSVNEMENLVLVTVPVITRLKELINTYPFAAQRLANQFSDSFRQKLIDMLVQANRDDLEKIFSLLKEMKIDFDRRFIDAGILSAFSISEKEESIPVFLNFITQHAPIKKIAAAHKEVENKTEKETIYISNAGLIILHPFLPQLFEELKFVKDGKWIDEETKHIAATVLEFIATGENEFAEFNLPLNKILCGIPSNDVLKSEKEINQEIKKACESLIIEVIQHWSVLKNTGIDSFRETFLRRNGKLTRVDDGWLLKVEQKGLDILLSHLPWGIGTIKLPWMNELLYTEW